MASSWTASVQALSPLSRIVGLLTSVEAAKNATAVTIGALYHEFEKRFTTPYMALTY